MKDAVLALEPADFVLIALLAFALLVLLPRRLLRGQTPAGSGAGPRPARAPARRRVE